MTELVNGMQLASPNSVIFGDCGDNIREYFHSQSILVGKLNTEVGIATTLFIIGVIVWGLETLRVKSLRAIFCFIAALSAVAYSGIQSRSVNRLGALSKYEVPPYWIFSYGTSAFATLSLCERSVVIIQKRVLRQRFLLALRVVVGLYIIFAISYGVYLTYGDEKSLKTTFFGYGVLPLLVLATAMNIAFLYYGFKHIVPNEIKLGITNSKIKTMFNYSAFFAVVTEVLFVLVLLDLILLVDSSYRSPHAAILLSLICLSEYCMDHGVHVNTYLNIKPAERPRIRSITSNDNFI